MNITILLNDNITGAYITLGCLIYHNSSCHSFDEENVHDASRYIDTRILVAKKRASTESRSDFTWASITNDATARAEWQQRKHQSSALLSVCEGNPSVPWRFTSQRASSVEMVTNHEVITPWVIEYFPLKTITDLHITLLLLCVNFAFWQAKEIPCIQSFKIILSG